jgi:hypothetical protein
MRAVRWQYVIPAIAIGAAAGCTGSSSGAAAGQQGPWTITASAGTGGAIAPQGAVQVPHGGSQAFTVTAAAGYAVSDVTVDGASQGAVAAFTFANVTAPHTIAATFAALPVTYTIAASAGPGGAIAPAGDVAVAEGGSQTFTFAADAGFEVSDVTVDGASQGAIAAFTFTNVTAPHTIAATFSALPVTFTITASAGRGGTISPSGEVAVVEGTSQTFTVAADAGFVISDVTVDGASQGAVAEFTFSNVTAPHAIAAAFAAQPTSAVVRLATQGTLPAGTLIGGVQVTLTYATDKGLSIAANGVVPSGAGAGSLLVANTNAPGQVIVALVNAAGIGTGELATATFAVAPPNVPVAADFAIAPGATVIDLTGAPIPGVTVAIAPPNVL